MAAPPVAAHMKIGTANASIRNMNQLSRRHFIQSTGFAAAFFASRRITEASPENRIVESVLREAVTNEVTVRTLRRGVSILEGAGGNILVVAGPDGKVLIDAGLAPSQAAIKKALAGISADPLKHLINTHWHFDHTGGNAWVGAEGAAIVAHENTRKRLAKATRVEDWDFTFPPAQKAALPTALVSQHRIMKLNDATIRLEHYAPAHTDADLSVYFEEADIFHTGDIWWNGDYPFLDYSTGGSIDGTIRAAQATLAKVGANTIIVPGHGPVGGRSELSEFVTVLTEIREQIGALKKRGLPVAEVVAAKPTASHDAKWAKFLIDGDFFTKLVYKGV
jgi:glyoxylase-like metal-dependent hydrolase (beta-lactamase superfamily II)